MSNQSTDSLWKNSAPTSRAVAARSVVPMKSLYERIDQVCSERKNLPTQLRNIAEEMPISGARRTLQRLAEAVQEKTSAATIVRNFPEHCWLLTIQSPAATTDAMTEMLEQSAYQHRLQAKKIRTIAYPMVLLVIAITILLLACSFVVPAFDEMFQDFELLLPLPTALVINLSRFVTGYPLLVALLVGLFVAALSCLLWLWIGDSVIKRKLFGMSNHLPAMRQSLAKVSTQVAELCDEGVSLDRSLRIAAESNSYPPMRSALGDLAVQVAIDPSKLSMTRAAIFLPPNFLLALNPSTAQSNPGEREGSSGNVTAVTPNTMTPNTVLLRELAANYCDLSLRRRDWMPFLIGQLSIIGVGLAIAFIVIALFAPMFGLITSLSG